MSVPVQRASELPQSADSPVHDDVVRPDPAGADAVERLLARIEAVLRQDRTARLVGPDGEAVDIPQQVFAALRLVVQAMARGQAVTVAPYAMELTTQQAADLLHVSRPHLVKLLEKGEIPFRRTGPGAGSHRRVLLDDVLHYRGQRARRRREQLRELTQMSQQVEGGYR